MNKKEELLKHPKYIDLYQKLCELETNREYCKHDFAHFCEVERICLEIQKRVSLEVPVEIWTYMAYLHDMGRVLEYQEKIPHDEASVEIAKEILSDLKVESDIISLVCEGIREHRHRIFVSHLDERLLDLHSVSEVLAIADQFSRDCYKCSVSSKCKWLEEEKIKSEWI